MKALNYEHQGNYLRASREWKSLPLQKNYKVQDHIFRDNLMSVTVLEHPTIPRTERSYLLASRFLEWQKKWSEALELLIKNQEYFSRKTDHKFEIIRLALILGRYDLAKSTLSVLIPSSSRKKTKLQILWIWYYILTGDLSEAIIVINRLEESTIYMPISAILPIGIIFPTLNSLKRLRKDLVRFPSDTEIFERMIDIFTQYNKWEELELLICSKQHFENQRSDWTVLAEVFYQTKQPEKYCRYFDRWKNVSQGLEFYDFCARMAIKERKWKILQRISLRLLALFPDLLDGKLYLAEYYYGTGNFEKYRKIRKELGMMVN